MPHGKRMCYSISIMERKTIQTLVYEELKKNIMSMRLKPGQTMSTQEVATKLGVSRTPVREAFLQLQSEALVEMIPQRETVVSRIDLKRVRQEKFIRECLELGVVNRFLEGRDEGAIRRMSELIEVQQACAANGDYVGVLEADDQFHKVLFDATDQQMAWATITSRNGHYNRLRILFIQTANAAEDSIRQHRKIIRCLEQEKPDQIREALTAHIQRLDVDETGLAAAYPDYFDTGDRNSHEPRIGAF